MKTLNLNKLLTEALDCHKKGNINEADKIYLKILDEHPNDFDSNHLHGVVLSQKQNYKSSIQYYEKAFSIKPKNCELLNNYAISLRNTNDYKQCEKILKKAISYDKNFTKSYLNLSNCYLEEEKYHQALKALLDGKKIDKKNIRLDQRIIGIYLQIYNRDKNASDLHKCIEVLDSIHINESFEQKLICNYALAYFWNNDLDRSTSLFKIAEKISQVPPNIKTLLGMKDRKVLEHLVKHEYEQICHIDSDVDGIRNMKITQDFFNNLEKVNNMNSKDYKEDDLNFISTLHKIKYNKPVKTEPPYLNENLDYGNIQSVYKSSHPEICIIDDILSQAFLTDLKIFFRCANIFKRPYPRGYVGTFLGTGMANKPILQFSKDLTLKLPDIFNKYHLTQAWAFKYDTQQKGIGIHADDAKVNVNLWLTPESANLDNHSGGMIIWKKKPNESSNFSDYNSSINSEKILQDVSESDYIRIPYKANRAVIFNSKLYHATDDINFDSKYINRRINVTFLYS
jgi:tetratricopeptide (TPR) repeat protein